jgi:lipopolysaccharide transport system ATP-binding protein
MSKPVVEIHNLSKKYLISHNSQSAYSTLRETISNKSKVLLQKIKHPLTKIDQRREELWALKDITLNITPGSRVGIIGRNGAGKSTLLKILSRITEPTHGKIVLRGSVSSLLEVGTGFHPELNGRENIYLNGSILGMSGQEIKRKFDQIVAFADIEKFLDTPVKRYSSGMIARLAFSVAAHLEPDVFIVDEVLAVGDQKFQEKCLDKMNEISTHGKTIFFVSHNMNTVLSLCDKVIYLEKGQLKAFGDVQTCVSSYLEGFSKADLRWNGNAGNSIVRVSQAKLENTQGIVPQYLQQGDLARVVVDFEILQPHHDLIMHVSVWHRRGQLLAHSRFTDNDGSYRNATSEGCKQLHFDFDTSLFVPGEYIIKFEVWKHPNQKIVFDEVLLRLPIYGLDEFSRLDSGIEQESVTLGNKWALEDKIALSAVR